jgi:Tol biopolymer transport system component
MSVRTFLAIGRRSRIQGWSIAAGTAILALIAPAGATAAFPGANGRIFFAGDDQGEPAGIYDLFSVNPDGSGLVNLTDLPGGPGEGTDPSVSADGTRVAFTVGSQAASEVWVMNADGSKPQQLTDSAGLEAIQSLDQMPGISPDGSRIAFMTTRETPPAAIGYEYDIWIMDADGTGQEPLLHGTGESYFPEFTPDGETVVMASEVTGDLDIARVPATGGPFSTAVSITGASNEIETAPSVRPDGIRVGYARRISASQYDIRDAYLSDGTDEFPIAADPALSETSPSFSPDGTKIAYAAGGQILVAASGGANPAPLALDAAIVQAPAQPEWAPAIADPADVEPPQTEITKAPKNRTSKRKARYRFESSQPGSRFECKLDRKAFKPCDSPRRYKRLQARRHRFKVRAVDAAGNADPTPAKDRFRVLKPD